MIRRGLGLFTMLVLLALPLTVATPVQSGVEGAQGPIWGPPMLPEPLHQREYNGHDLKKRPLEPSEIAQRAEADMVHPTSFNWQIERVDAPKSFESMGDRSLKLDGSNRPHIAYGADHLYYAWYDGTTWHLEVMDPSWGVGRYTSLALDVNDRPHISYYDETKGDLQYAYFDGASWITETVDSSEDVGRYTSLALDSNAWPHISYLDYTNNDLKYAHFDGASWITETVDNSGNVGRYTSLALEILPGGQARPHISYRDYTNSDLKYAHFDGTSWITETVDNSGYVGRYTSLALDASDRPHISYYDSTNDDLKYARGEVECVPVASVNIEGLGGLLVGQTGLYAASYTPPTATVPVMLTWDNGTISPTATYSWTNPGLYTVTVTATNPCGQTKESLLVQVTEECRPVERTTIAGPAGLLVGQTGLYTATYTPLTATTPVTITWDNGTVGPTATYSWTDPGTYTVTVTATNFCGQAVDTFVVTVSEPPCVPVSATSIEGPAALPAGQTGLYTATYSPPTATQPLTLTWDNGSLGSTAAYSWTYPATYTVTVVVENACSLISDTLPVEVRPIEGLISPGGGVLYSPPDETTYLFPTGTFSETVLVTHIPRGPSSVPPPGDSLVGIHHFFSVTAAYSATGEPAELTPGASYTVTIGYTDEEEGPTIEETLALYRWDGTSWTQEGITSTVDIEANTVTAQVDSLGLFGVLGETYRIHLPLVLRNH